MSKLHNVRGRITYISSHAKQENLYAVYETTDRPYWTELARYNQQEFLKSGTEGKCIEARELIIALPESFPDLYYPDKLLQLFTNRFKEKYGVECVSALHHNKRKTNYHIHLIFSERELLEEPLEKIATRNMFYDEQGRHVRTKKEILDDNGNIRKGCKVIKKGEVYERILFTTKKIGKNNPKAEQIKSDNDVRMQWNHEVDQALVCSVPEDEIRQIKKEFITDRIRQSIEAWGKEPSLLANIITHATMRLALLISKVRTAARELKNKLFHESLESEYGSKVDVTESIKATDTTPVTEETKPEPTATITKAEVNKAPKPKIPPRPVMSPEAAAYPKLQKIYALLNKQIEIIFEAERERNTLEFERDDLKGFAKLTKKKEFDSRIASKNEEIQVLKAELSAIIRQHGFATVQDFYRALHTAQNAFDTYQTAYAKWDETYGEKAPKPETMQEKLQRYKEQVAQQNASQPYPSRDKGAR